MLVALRPGLPSNLLIQRPDIVAAEHQLKATHAHFGAARAAFFPKVSLTGAMGTASAELEGLFAPGSQAWIFSRKQFWDQSRHIRSERHDMSVIVATAYMEEADRFDWLVAMDAGTVLATSMPESLRTRIAAGTGNTGVACGPESLRTLIATASLEEAFITLLPEEKRRGHRAGWYRPWRPRSRPRSPSRSRG